MTPEEYVSEITRLVSSSKDDEALEFAARYSTAIIPLLTAEQLDLTTGLLESAQLVVDLEEAALAENQALPPTR